MSLLLTNPMDIFDPHLGFNIDPDELASAMAIIPMLINDFLQPIQCASKSAASSFDSGSQITKDEKNYQVSVDVKQFTPEEITVKTIGREIIIEGKHEEKEDEHGYISRQFVRKYILPKDYKLEEVTSSLSSDGFLNITAPKQTPAIADGERTIQITRTGPVNTDVKPSQINNDK